MSLNKGPFIEISEEDFNNIRYLVENKDNIQQLGKFIQNLCGFTDIVSHDLSKLVYNSPCKNQIIDYLHDRTTSIDQLIQEGNFYNAFQFCDKLFLDKLYYFTYKSSRQIGNGEVLLTLLVKDASKSTCKGDVIINNTEIEVKADGGRLKGHIGYNSGETASKVWNMMLLQLCTTYNLDIPVPPGGSVDYNFLSTKEALKGYGYALFRIGQELIIKSGNMFTSNDLINICVTGLTSVYTELSRNDFNWIEELVDSQGVIKDYVQFRTHFAAMLVEYYMSRNGIETIISIESSGSLNLLNARYVSRYYQYITIRQWPSFSSGAGNFGQVPTIGPLKTGTPVFKL